MNDEDVAELKRKRACHNCTGEPYLKDQVRTMGKVRKCSYCKKVASSASLEDLAHFVSTAFEHHYYRTSDQPTGFQWSMMRDEESTYDWERDGEPVVDAIANSAEICDELAADIQKILEGEFYSMDSAQIGEENEFSSDSYYERKSADGYLWHSEWREFERALKTQTRYFSQKAAAHLTALFDDIESMPTKGGKPIIIDAGPETRLTHFYRARVFQSDERLEQAIQRPDLEIGPPPPALAGSGRMNARGISVFYGATTPETALAEVRPPVGSKVVVARFELLRPMRLLDLRVLPDIEVTGSIFDPSLAPRQERAVFLRTLKSIITVPVMPDDEELEYIITQAIADFLATQERPSMDGIVFPSVQVAGQSTNVVLFHKSSRVKDLELPRGSRLSSSSREMDEDSPHYDFIVYETVPKGLAKTPKKDAGPPSIYHLWDRGEETEPRTESLKIDLDSVEVRIIGSVSFTTENHKVNRYRSESEELAEKLKSEEDNLPF